MPRQWKRKEQQKGKQFSWTVPRLIKQMKYQVQTKRNETKKKKKIDIQVEMRIEEEMENEKKKNKLNIYILYTCMYSLALILVSDGMLPIEAIFT